MIGFVFIILLALVIVKLHERQALNQPGVRESIYDELLDAWVDVPAPEPEIEGRHNG